MVSDESRYPRCWSDIGGSPQFPVAQAQPRVMDEIVLMQSFTMAPTDKMLDLKAVDGARMRGLAHV